jgi:hypothetical protein
MPRQTFRIENRASRRTTTTRVLKVTSFWGRLTGLAGRQSLHPETGIWLIPCNGVHTFGMRFALDIIVLDREMRVLQILREVPPGRICRGVTDGFSTLEMPAGAAFSTGVVVGDQLEASPAEGAG